MAVKARSQLPTPISQSRNFDVRDQHQHESRSPVSLTQSKSSTSSLPGIRSLRKAFQLSGSKKDAPPSSDRQLSQSLTSRNVISKSPSARSGLPVRAAASLHNVSHARSLSDDSAPLRQSATVPSIPSAKPISSIKHVLPAPPEPMSSLSSPLARSQRQIPRPLPMRISGEMPSIGMTVSQSLPASSMAWTTPQNSARLPKEFLPSPKQNGFSSRLPQMGGVPAPAKQPSVGDKPETKSSPLLASTPTYTLYLKPDFVRSADGKTKLAAPTDAKRSTPPQQELPSPPDAVTASPIPDLPNSPKSATSLQSFESMHSSEGYNFPYSSHLQQKSSRSESRTSRRLSGEVQSDHKSSVPAQRSAPSPLTINSAVMVYPSSPKSRSSPASPLSELVNRLSMQLSHDSSRLSAGEGQQPGISLRRTSRNSTYSVKDMDTHSLRSDEDDALQTASAEGSDASPLIPQEDRMEDGESLPNLDGTASIGSTGGPRRPSGAKRELDSASNASKSWTMNDVEEAYDRMRSHLHAAGRRVSEVTEGDRASIRQPDQMPPVNFQYIESLLTGPEPRTAVMPHADRTVQHSVAQHLVVTTDAPLRPSSQASSRGTTPSSRSSGQWAEVTPTSQGSSLPVSAATTVSPVSALVKGRAMSPDNFLELDTTIEEPTRVEQIAATVDTSSQKLAAEMPRENSPDRFAGVLVSTATSAQTFPDPSEAAVQSVSRSDSVVSPTTLPIPKIKASPPSRLHLPTTPRSIDRTSGSSTPTTWFDDTPRAKRTTSSTRLPSRLPRMHSDRGVLPADATNAIHDAKKADKLDLFLRCAKAESAHAALLQQSELEREALLDALQESRTAIAYLREERSALQKALAQSQLQSAAM